MTATENANANNAEHIPVIIGVGQVNDRPDNSADGLDSMELMVAALRRAADDAGGASLSDIDSLAIVDQISFPDLGDLCVPLSAAIEARPTVKYQSATPHGDTPIRFLNEAANRIGAGKSRLGAIVGAEAMRTAMKRAAENQTSAAEAGQQAKTGHQTARYRGTRHHSAYGKDGSHAEAYGVIAPVHGYPLYENSLRAMLGQSLAEAQRESAELWHMMSRVAAENPGAWLRKPHSVDDILTVNQNNRPLAFPYSKLMVANNAVNQGAAFLTASLAEARRRNIAEDRLIYVGMGAAAKEPADILQRDRFDHSVSMEVSLRRTLELNDKAIADIDHVELYSCFPCVPKMARRILNWPVDRSVSVFGGLTFGGGPIGNYMSHAVVSMVETLRRHRGVSNGFLFANGGFATDNHCILLSTQPVEAAVFPQDFDYQGEADAARSRVPALDRSYCGPAVIESYTLFYRRSSQPRGGVVIALTPQGRRSLAHVDAKDTKLVAFLTDGSREPIGTAGHIVASGTGGAGDEDEVGAEGRYWHSAASVTS